MCQLGSVIQVEVWMCSPLGVFLGTKNPVNGSRAGGGVGASCQCPLGLEEPPRRQAGTVPSMPSSPGSGF